MAKYILAVVISVAYMSALLAQKNVTVGKPYTVIDADQKLYFTNHGEILTIKLTRKAMMIQKLNAVNLSFQKIKLYSDFPKDYQLEKITAIRNRYFVFYSLWDGDNEQLFYREIDFAAGSFKGPGKKLFSVSEKISGAVVRTGFMRRAVSDKFDFYFSYDSSSMVVQYRLVPELRNDSKNYDVIGAHVFDQNLNEKWSGKIKMPYTEEKMDNLDYSVDAKGNVYIVTKVYDDIDTEAKRKDKKATNYHLEILKAAKSTGVITSSKVDVTNHFIKTIWLYETAKGYMIGGGFYNNGKDMANVDGMILFKLGQDGKVFDLVTHEIPLEILNQYASKKEKRKNKNKEEDDRAEFTDLDLQHIDVQTDGSVVMLAEQNLVQTHTTYTTTGSSRTYYTYHSNDILVTKITASGKLAWMKKLPKQQMSGKGFDGISYHYFRGRADHYLMFLDNEKNLKLPNTEVPSLHVDGNGGFLTAYKINDESGSITKISLLDTRDVNGVELFQFQPGRMMATAPSTIVFEAYKKHKEDVLVKIVLE